MTPLSWLATAFILAGLFFFVAGTVGLMRLPDRLSRLHALTKADNVGLGLLVLGLLLEGPGLLSGIKLVLIWLFVLVASATGAHLIAKRALRGDGEDAR
ncbi:cation:proton antiporter [Allochromatium tepidum]|uniref:Cation:proton antiporter n=1 Tax=Allochromatium tepidum TaxID=553982 RepID=A0ABM7QMK8_9GAMM|nr:monovalent cation/H(+) antiporter subunit G [Allochromatium tepidum]BCU06973.1 cation:proton antiporter [Allochromatium tepidum]